MQHNSTIYFIINFFAGGLLFSRFFAVSIIGWWGAVRVSSLCSDVVGGWLGVDSYAIWLESSMMSEWLWLVRVDEVGGVAEWLGV